MSREMIQSKKFCKSNVEKFCSCARKRGCAIKREGAVFTTFIKFHC